MLASRRTLVAGFALGALLLMGAGCQDVTPPKPTPPPEAQFDVTKTSCADIPAARGKVADAYAASIQAAGDDYVKAHELFQADLDACLKGIWQGGPCDKEWQASQAAYQHASSDISNDQFYKEWKKAKSDWDECTKGYDQKLQDWSDKNKQAEQLCRDEYQAKSNAAETAYYDAKSAAEKKRDADNAYLDDLEKKCKEAKPTGGTGTTGLTGETPPSGGTVSGFTTTYHPQSPACQDEGATVPGENAQPRQGKASDFGPQDILVGLMTTVAEDVTGTPIPTGAINDQLFASVVCVKIRTRIIEMDKESIDHITDNRWQRRYEQQRSKYDRALSVWCAIAEGKTSVPQVKKDVAALNAMPSGGCKTDADCGQPICCSASEKARFTCDASTGACQAVKEPCEDPTVCGGQPAECVQPPKKVKAIRYGSKYLPLAQMKIENETGCGADHYHAKYGGVVHATDGSFVYDPGPQCGYGKVRETPTIDVLMPGDYEETK